MDNIQLPSREEVGRLAQSLGCLGYFGFGGGLWVGKQPVIPKGTPSLCNETCPFSDACWVYHKARVRKLWPALTAIRERLFQQGYRKLRLDHELRLRVGGDPFILMTDANAEDGTRVATSGRPIERGPFTLTIPLTPIMDVLENKGLIVS